MNNQRNVSAGTGAASAPGGVAGVVREHPSPSQEGTCGPDEDVRPPTRTPQRSEPLQTPGFLHPGDPERRGGAGAEVGWGEATGEGPGALRGATGAQRPAAHFNTTPPCSSWGQTV